MSKIERINTRIKNIERRFKTKVSKGRKGTDMDIERHERRIEKLRGKYREETIKQERNMPESPLGFRMPHSPLNQNENKIDYSNMTSEQKTSLGKFWDKEIKNYGGNITPGNDGYNELVGENAYAVYDRGRFEPDGKGGGSYPHKNPRWRTRHGGTDGKPEHIHPNQAFKMYQGKNNIYE